MIVPFFKPEKESAMSRFEQVKDASGNPDLEALYKEMVEYGFSHICVGSDGCASKCDSKLCE